jgi:hypothetical protein
MRWFSPLVAHRRSVSCPIFKTKPRHPPRTVALALATVALVVAYGVIGGMDTASLRLHGGSPHTPPHALSGRPYSGLVGPHALPGEGMAVYLGYKLSSRKAKTPQTGICGVL